MKMKAWLARDKKGEIWAFGEKPQKLSFQWREESLLFKLDEEWINELPSGINPKWSDTEPVEVEITITKAKVGQTMKAWIARDSSGIVCLFGQKPKKDYSVWHSDNAKALLYVGENFFLVPEGVNPRWEDEEPIELDITITRASKEI